MGVVRALIAEGGSRWRRGQKGARWRPSRSSLLPFSFSLSPCPLSLVFVFRGLGSREFKSFHLNNPIYRPHPRRAPFCACPFSEPTLHHAPLPESPPHIL